MQAQEGNALGQRDRNLGQRGFSLLELLIVMSIIGVLSMIAVPRFNNAIALANTSKVQSDLRTLNTAIVMYQAEKGSYPTSISTDLKDYIVDVDNLKPPKGKCLLRTGSSVDITAASYSLSEDHTEALCQDYKAGDFGRKE